MEITALIALHAVNRSILRPIHNRHVKVNVQPEALQPPELVIHRQRPTNKSGSLRG